LKWPENLEKDPSAAVVVFGAVFITMEFNMTGKTVIRTLLVLALIVTAHTIKPFSIKNVTNHLLYSTKSFKFVLPVRLRDNFDHANYLAINLSNSLFDTGSDIQSSMKDTVATLLPIKAQSLDEVNKSATRPRTKPKQSAPAKRINPAGPGEQGRTERSDSSGLIASVNSDEIMPVEAPPEAIPVVCPVVQPYVIRAGAAKVGVGAPLPQVVLLQELKKSDCEKRAVTRNQLIALIASECEEQKTEVLAEEIEIEVAEPEEEVVEPQQPDEQKPGPLAAPVEKCPWEP
jgi:hypothetical protein